MWLLNVDGCTWKGREGRKREGESMRDSGKKKRHGVGGWLRRQTQFGVVVVQSIAHLLIVVSEWTSGDWCVRACVRAFV